MQCRYWNDKWRPVRLESFISSQPESHWFFLEKKKKCFSPLCLLCLFVVLWLTHRCTSYTFISCFLSLYFCLTVGCHLLLLLLLLCEQTDPASVPQLAWQFVAAQKAVNPILAFCRGDTVHFLLVRIMSIAFYTGSKIDCEFLLKPFCISSHNVLFLTEFNTSSCWYNSHSYSASQLDFHSFYRCAHYNMIML